MSAQSFWKATANALQSVGFVRHGNILQFRGSDATILIGLEKALSDQAFIGVGFWLHSLGESPPIGIEKSHAYVRLDRLFPAWREVILLAGSGEGESQVRNCAVLIDEIHSNFGKTLRSMASSEFLCRKILANDFLGLVRKELRAHCKETCESPRVT